MSKFGLQIGVIFGTLSLLIIIAGGMIGGVGLTTIISRLFLISVPMYLSGFLIEFVIQRFGLDTDSIAKEDKVNRNKDPKISLDNKEMNLTDIFGDLESTKKSSNEISNSYNKIDVKIGEDKDYAFEPEKTADVIKQLLKQED